MAANQDSRMRGSIADHDAIRRIQEQYYAENKDKVYANFGSPKGVALIINQNVTRKGTEFDKEALVSLFKSLDYTIDLHEDLTADGIIQCMTEFAARTEHKKASSAVICIMTHGKYDILGGTDDKRVSIYRLLELLSGRHAPSLKGKPKLVFIQACRGLNASELEERGLEEDHSWQLAFDKKHAARDILVSYSTAPLRPSKRDRDFGSWYMQMLCEVLQQEAAYMDILEMMTVVNDRIQQHDSSGFAQAPDHSTRLTKRFFFFPPPTTFDIDLAMLTKRLRVDQIMNGGQPMISIPSPHQRPQAIQLQLTKKMRLNHNGLFKAAGTMLVEIVKSVSAGAYMTETVTVPVHTLTETLVIYKNERQFFTHFTDTVEFKIPLGYEGDTKLKFLGSGTYGNVIKSEYIARDGELRVVAIKKYYDPFVNSEKASRLYRELRLLEKMNHDSVIRALDLYSPQNNFAEFKDVYVVSEYGGISLDKILKDQHDTRCHILNSDNIREIIYQLLKALKYIHSANILHRDLKPKNIAFLKIGNICKVKLLDFDTARPTGEQLSDYVQTRHYRAPEVIFWKPNNYDKQADMWSLGCIAAEMLQQRVLFPGDFSYTQYNLITDLCGSPDEILRDKIEKTTSKAMQKLVVEQRQNKPRLIKRVFSDLPPDAIVFLDKILVLDPDRRMTVDDALSHPYIAASADNVSVADADFTLEDDVPGTVEQCKVAIWNLIQKFQGNDHSPVFQ